MKRLLTGLIAAAALVAVAALSPMTSARADGLFSGYPISGGSAYCNAYTNGVCSSTIQAGPAPAGTERIPADSGFSQGRSPQTVLIPSAALGTGAIQYETPLTGATITVKAAGVGTPVSTTTTSKLIIKPAGTIAALTVVLPPASALVDGHRITISPTQIVTALTLTPGSGTTVNNTTTALAAGTPVTYFYRAADTSWYRGS